MKRAKNSRQHHKHSKSKELLRLGLSGARVFLHDLASLFSWAADAAGHNRGMGWAEYEDM